MKADPHRRRRTREELDEIYASHPEIEALRDRLREIEGLQVEEDGGPDTDSVFKVYLQNRTGSFESFLWVYKTLDGSFVSWGRQDGHDEACRREWKDLVRNPAGSGGSYLRAGVKPVWIVDAARRYVAAATTTTDG